MTQNTYQPRFIGLTRMHTNQLPTRVPVSNLSEIDMSSGFSQKRRKLKRKEILTEITRMLFEETEVSHGEDRNSDNLGRDYDNLGI